MKRRDRLLVWAAATDATFEPAALAGETVLVGKCIHCGRKLVVGFDGRARGRPATLEHLLPRAAGGADRLDNLAVACATCNHHKGVRTDDHWGSDPRARARVDAALARRMRRWRDPPQSWALPRLPRDAFPSKHALLGEHP
ncbi:MAG: HNH endonuclease [Deltaproteobacteria bacterium]|nr:MAG: HNH endonuclease [Deltaproteobacteria bacterium]